MCTPLAGGIRGKPSPTRGLARHSRGRSCPLLTRRSQTLCSGPVVTARKMKYFEEGHHDRRTDRRSQLIKFVSEAYMFPVNRRIALITVSVALEIRCDTKLRSTPNCEPNRGRTIR